jgi:hypothetical protein
MTPEQLYAIWAPQDSVWSPWVLPVPFAELSWRSTPASPQIPTYPLEWIRREEESKFAIVADLPGADAILFGLALLEFGFRPVPVIDGSPGPSVGVMIPPDLSVPQQRPLRSPSVVDMRGLLLALWQGAKPLQLARLSADAPPAFLLDSKRMVGGVSDEQAFDNRWMVFPQDFPSARFLLSKGIKKVVFVHDTFQVQPQEDLAHILLRWQEAGIAVESKSARFGEVPVPIRVTRPYRFRAAWYRALAVLGLRRNDAGGFGGYPPPSSSGAG